jgi:hypothetical protein
MADIFTIIPPGLCPQVVATMGAATFGSSANAALTAANDTIMPNIAANITPIRFLLILHPTFSCDFRQNQSNQNILPLARINDTFLEA